MRKYEVTYVLIPELEEEQVTEKTKGLKSVIEKNGGEPLDEDFWGKRRLAYEINDYQEGIYSLLTFNGDSQVLSELERAIKLDGDFLRYLIVRSEEE